MFNKNYVLENRIKIINIILFIFFVVLVGRTIYVNEKFSSVATSTVNNSIEEEKIGNYNYLLLDRNGRDLNEYKRKYKVVIEGRTLKVNSIKQNLENFITFNYIMKEAVEDFNIEKIIGVAGKFSYNVSEEAYNKIKSLDGLKGIYAYQYDEKENIDNWSIESILMKEKAYNPYEGLDNFDKSEESLEGKIMRVTKENKLPTIRFEKDIEAIYNEIGYNIDEDNANIKLTIDSEIQQIIREVLSREEYDIYENVGVAITDAQNGEILGLAQQDESKPNILTGSGAIKGFDAGSTFKVMTLAAALENKGVGIYDKYECKGLVCKSINIHGEITVEEALEVSCNDIFVELGFLVGYDNLLDFSKEHGYFESVLGLDKKTGMESSGERLSKERIEQVQGNIAIGQEVKVTPLQVLSSLSSITNNGEHIDPFIIKGIESQAGKMLETYEGKKEDVISKQTANTIKMLLARCVENGTGKRASVPGVLVGGKTGTTESENNTSHGWFLGYFELNNKLYNMVVFVPNIEGKGENGKALGGGTTAAPIFKEIVTEIAKK
ncbi:MAG: penicillin-binding transpeptidase domain-containing protein [Sarcina sp.]